MTAAPGPEPAGYTDVHAHAMPRPLLAELAARGLARLDGLADGHVLIDPRVSGVPEGARIPCPAEQFDIPARLAAMDRAGCALQAVSLPPFVTAGTTPDTAFADEIVALGNDALAAYVAQAPGRLRALATLPVGSASAVREARRCLDDLAVAGFAIGTQGGGHDLDAPVNEPLWAFLAERGSFVLVHPNASPSPARTADYWMPQLVGYPAETAIAVSRLVLGGVLERHALRLCLAHGGGCLPALRGRLDLGWRRKEAARTTPHPPSHYLDRLYYDTAVFDDGLLRHLVDRVGPRRILVGTDFPFDLCDTTAGDTVRRLGLSDEAARRITHDNAADLLRTPTLQL
ncbi:amidohydrolase family protein [Streptomyces sp. NPDC038707]|uniref:amidohydrolase family protein n=1 Tax=unclassified Streptomyces TaxID=2593676 RepID=UPI00340DC56A